jgi:hypothetical protein
MCKYSYLVELGKDIPRMDSETLETMRQNCSRIVAQMIDKELRFRCESIPSNTYEDESEEDDEDTVSDVSDFWDEYLYDDDFHPYGQEYSEDSDIDEFSR